MEIKIKMPGKIRYYTVEENELVQKGAQLASLEALRLEHKIIAPAAGMVKKILALPGERLAAGTVIMLLEEG